MKILLFVALIASFTILRADDDPDEVEPCTFAAHTPVGTLSGFCTTQNIPTKHFKEYWKLTLTFDEQSAPQAARLQPDYFYDMFRSQSVEDGSSVLILPLWGDFVLKPTSQEYLAELQAKAPLYETRPHEIAISVVSTVPLTIEFLFTEHSNDFDLARRSPSAEWLMKYLESFYRLGTNRPDGFSKEIRP